MENSLLLIGYALCGFCAAVVASVYVGLVDLKIKNKVDWGANALLGIMFGVVWPIVVAVTVIAWLSKRIINKIVSLQSEPNH